MLIVLALGALSLTVEAWEEYELRFRIPTGLLCPALGVREASWVEAREASDEGVA